MKIIVNGLDLNDAIARVGKALPTRDVSPILECIKIVAENDKMTLFATDKDLAIEKTIDANVVVAGSFLVPGKFFSEYIRSIAMETEISLEMDDGNKLFISSQNSECNIACQDVINYPDVEKPEKGEKAFAITEGNLKDAINKVIFSVATDDTRPILKGVNVKANEYVLTTVATDGYRFARCKKVLESKVEGEINCTVPARSFNELAKLLSDSDDIVNVVLEKNNMMVRLDGTTLMTRLLTEGQYIKYENIIPTEFVTTLIVDKVAFERSLNIASIISRSDKNNIVVLDIGEYIMHIQSTSELGAANEQMEIAMEGKDIRCTYNSRYIADCIKVMTSEKIKMEFNAHNSCIITEAASDEVLYFILPVRTI
jgi:DNA polymerase-3 subunit beta